MLSNLALFAANRATQGAVGSITRWASWGAVAALFFGCAVVFGSVAAYQYLTPMLGPVEAAGLIAGSTLILALACITTPALLDMMERHAAKRHRDHVGPVTSTVESVSEETKAAVDYFGPLQVVTSAFLVGLRTGSQMRGPRPT